MEICHDVLLEHQLQELSDEALSYGSTNRQDQAHESAHFEVRICNSFARTYVNSFIFLLWTQWVWKKKNLQPEIREIEHGSFTPLVFSAAGG